MSNFNSHNDDPFFSDDALDELIRRADWQDADEQSLVRLQSSWETIHRDQSQWRRWYLFALAAAIAFVAGTIGIAYWVTLAPHNNVVENDPTAADSGAHEDENAMPRHPRTAYEQVFAASAERQLRDRANKNGDVRRQMVTSLTQMHEPSLEAAKQLAEQVQLEPDAFEDELGRLCLVLRGQRLRNAIELFNHVATTRSLDVYAELWQRGNHRANVTKGILILADARQLAQCFAQARLPHVRHDLASALVEQIETDDMMWFAQYVAGQRYPQELTEALRRSVGFPAKELLGLLDHPQRKLRFASARLVGLVDDMDTTRVLIARVTQNKRRQEALLALSQSENPVAVQFMAQVRQQPTLAATLQSAYVQANVSLPWYGG